MAGPCASPTPTLRRSSSTPQARAIPTGGYSAGVRDTELLPVQREVDLRAAATRIIEGLWQQCLLRWFADFDRSIVTNDGILGVDSPLAIPFPRATMLLGEDGRGRALLAGGRRPRRRRQDRLGVSPPETR